LASEIFHKLKRRTDKVICIKEDQAEFAGLWLLVLETLIDV